MNASYTLMKLRVKILAKVNTIANRIFNDKYLIYTNVGLSITLGGLGDIIEQHYEILNHELDKWDRTRTRNMSLCGMTIGIFCHNWYNYLDRRLPGYAVRTVIKKIVVDQIVASPVCIATLFATSAVLEKKSPLDLLTEMRQKAWILYVAEWTVWPPAQFINFYFLPTRFRVLFDNTVSLGYDIFTSYIKHKELDDKKS